jgi:hypothetical protein
MLGADIELTVMVLYCLKKCSPLSLLLLALVKMLRVNMPCANAHA